MMRVRFDPHHPKRFVTLGLLSTNEKFLSGARQFSSKIRSNPTEWTGSDHSGVERSTSMRELFTYALMQTTRAARPWTSFGRGRLHVG